MTLYETIISRIGCNLCDNPNIVWSDENNKNHLCKLCMDNQKLGGDCHQIWKEVYED